MAHMAIDFAKDFVMNLVPSVIANYLIFGRPYKIFPTKQDQGVLTAESLGPIGRPLANVDIISTSAKTTIAQGLRKTLECAIYDTLYS